MSQNDTDSQWTDVDLPFGPVFKFGDGTGEDEKDSATKRGIIKPGILLETENGLILVGHVTPGGGQCDHCNIGKDIIVKRYKVVWTEEKNICPNRSL